MRVATKVITIPIAMVMVMVMMTMMMSEARRADTARGGRAPPRRRRFAASSFFLREERCGPGSALRCAWGLLCFICGQRTGSVEREA